MIGMAGHVIDLQKFLFVLQEDSLSFGSAG